MWARWSQIGWLSRPRWTFAAHEIVTAGMLGTSLGCVRRGFGFCGIHVRKGRTSRPISSGCSQWVQDLRRWHAPRGRARDGWMPPLTAPFLSIGQHTKKLSCNIWPTVHYELRMLWGFLLFAQSNLRFKSQPSILSIDACLPGSWGGVV